MSVKDCIKLVRDLDPEDATNFNNQLKSLTDAGIPAADAYTQAAELVMEDVLSERNALAAEIREKGGYLEDLTIENLLNPASYKVVESAVESEPEPEVVEEAPLDSPPDDVAPKAKDINVWKTSDIKIHKDSGGLYFAEHKWAGILFEGNVYDNRTEARRDAVEILKERKEESDNGAAMRMQKQKKNHRRNVRRWLGVTQKRLSNRLNIEVVNSPEDAPIPVPEDAVGYSLGNQIYIFADNLPDAIVARQVLEHEAIGHLGLEGALGKRKFNELIGDVNNIKVEMMFDAKAYPQIRKLVAELKQTYVDADGEYALDPREEAREILAHIAHSKPRLGPLREVYNKITAWVREWAATMGLADPTMAMIESMMVRATTYVRDPGKKYTQLDNNKAVVSEQPLEEADDTEKPAFMRQPNRPEFDEMSEQEQELYKKLGLGPVGTQSLWRKLRDIRTADIKNAMKSATARGYEGLFDGLIEVKRKELEFGTGLGHEMTYLDKKGVRRKTVDYAGSSYVGMRLATGVADMMTHLLNYGSLQWGGGVVVGVENTRGFLDVLADLGHDKVNDWLVWMAGNRAEELMADGREHNLDAEQIALAKTKNTGNEELFTRIKNEYNAMNSLQLDFAEQAGLINAEKRADWDSEWYVPFYRQGDEEYTLGPRTQRGLSHQTAGIRRLMGSELATADLLENLLANWIKLTDASVKNNALRLMVDNFQDSEYIQNETLKFTKAIVPKSQIAKLIQRDRQFAAMAAEHMGMENTATELEIINELRGLDKEGFESFWAITAPKEPDIVRVQRDGKNEYWRVKVPGLLRATGHISETGSNVTGMRAARWFKRLLTTGVTASPDFMLRNFIRDAAHSWAINKDGMKFAKDSLNGLKKAAAEDPIHQAMMAAGASFQGGYVHGTDPEQTAQIMRRELVKSGLAKTRIDKYLGSLITTPGKLESVVRQGWQHYRAAGDKIENASRVATAVAGREAGKPDAQWLFESKDLMDYSRRGNFAMLIAFTDVLPFLNARMQGLDKLGRAFKEDPKIVGQKMLWIAGFSVALAWMNDDDDRYQGLPDWEKDAYWHFFVGDDHWRIPKPFEIGFIAGTIPERMFRTWGTESQASAKLKWSLMHGTLETLNINPIPQIVLPMVEVKANRKFYFDQPIESMSDKRVIPKERYNQYTSESAIMLSEKVLGDMPEYLKWLELSPKQIQHLWNGYTGTMGAYALEATDMVTRGALDFPSPAETQIEDLPIAKSFYRGSRKKTTQWQVDFYDRLKEVQQLYGTLQKHRKAGEKEKFLTFQKEHSNKLKRRKMMERAQKSFSQMRKRRESILRDDTLSRAEKYQQSQAIQARIDNLAKKIERDTRAAFSE